MTSLTVTLPRLHEKQQQIYDDDHRFKVLVCGRRFGKTELGKRTIFDTIINGGRAAYFTPVYRQQKEVWAGLHAMLSPIVTRSNITEKRMEFLGGGLVEFWNYGDTVRGTYYDDVILDEIALQKDEFFFELVVRPLLADTEGRASLLTTPRGRNWVYKYWQRGFDPAYPDWASWRFPTSANPHIKKVEIEAARRDLSKQAFGQEYLAEFTSLAGAVYPDWLEEENVSASAEYDPNYPVFWTVDDGHADPRVILFLQVRPFEGMASHVCVFDEISVTNQISARSIEDALERPYALPDKVYHDPSALEFSAMCHEYGLDTWGGFNKVEEGINIVRRYILNTSGMRILRVHPRCKVLSEAMLNYSYKDGSNPPKPTHDEYSHAADALRYFLATYIP